MILQNASESYTEHQFKEIVAGEHEVLFSCLEIFAVSTRYQVEQRLNGSS